MLRLPLDEKNIVMAEYYAGNVVYQLLAVLDFTVIEDKAALSVLPLEYQRMNHVIVTKVASFNLKGLLAVGSQFLELIGTKRGAVAEGVDCFK